MTMQLVQTLLEVSLVLVILASPEMVSLAMMLTSALIPQRTFATTRLGLRAKTLPGHSTAYVLPGTMVMVLLVLTSTSAHWAVTTAQMARPLARTQLEVLPAPATPATPGTVLLAMMMMSAHSELTTVRTTARCHAQMYLAVSYASVLLGIPGTESLVPTRTNVQLTTEVAETSELPCVPTLLEVSLVPAESDSPESHPTAKTRMSVLIRC